MVPFCWQPDGRGNKNLIQIGSRNTDNIKIAAENDNLCGKICDMRTFLKYAKNVAISKIRGWQPHIRIKLTCLESIFAHSEQNSCATIIASSAVVHQPYFD